MTTIRSDILQSPAEANKITVIYHNCPKGISSAYALLKALPPAVRDPLIALGGCFTGAEDDTRLMEQVLAGGPIFYRSDSSEGVTCEFVRGRHVFVLDCIPTLDEMIRVIGVCRSLTYVCSGTDAEPNSGILKAYCRLTEDLAEVEALEAETAREFPAQKEAALKQITWFTDVLHRQETPEGEDRAKFVQLSRIGDTCSEYFRHIGVYIAHSNVVSCGCLAWLMFHGGAAPIPTVVDVDGARDTGAEPSREILLFQRAHRLVNNVSSRRKRSIGYYTMLDRELTEEETERAEAILEEETDAAGRLARAAHYAALGCSPQGQEPSEDDPRIPILIVRENAAGALSKGTLRGAIEIALSQSAQRAEVVLAWAPVPSSNRIKLSAASTKKVNIVHLLDGLNGTSEVVGDKNYAECEAVENFVRILANCGCCGRAVDNDITK